MKLLPIKLVGRDGNRFDALTLPPPPPPIFVSTGRVDVVVVIVLSTTTGACISQPLRLLLLDD